MTRTITGAALAAIALVALAGAPLGPVLVGTVLGSAWLVWRARGRG